MSLEAFARRFGHRFEDRALLLRALTHRSHGPAHNERLEFLGDSVLNCAVAFELYCRFPDLPEGELSRLRAHLVNQETLAATARGLDLGSVLLLGEGELRSGGAERPSILADALEAVVGAVFLDGGYQAALEVVQGMLADVLMTLDPATSGKDPKTTLQEHLQAHRIGLPQYAVVATRGVAHKQAFEVECVIPELGIRTLGEGSSRRSAEQCAARLAYERATRG
jgi:ribonuclease-3